MIAMMRYSYRVATEVVNSREFRREVITKLADIYSKSDIADYVSICECKFLLNDPANVAMILSKLPNQSLAL